MMNEKTSAYINKLATLASMAVVAASPFAIKRIFERPTVSQVAFIQLSMVSVGLLYFPLLLFLGRVSFNLTRTTFFLILYLFVMILSSLLSSYPLFSIMETHFIFPFILFYFMFQSLRLTERGLRKVILIPVLISIPIALYGILQGFDLDVLGYDKSAMFEKKKIVSFLGNPNYVGSYIAPLFPITLGMAGLARRNALRFVFLGVSAGQFLVLILAGARASWLGLFVGMILMIALSVKVGGVSTRISLKNIAVILAIFLLLILVSLVFIELPFSPLERLFSTRELYSRFFIWQISMNIFLERPLLGIGYNQIQSTINDYVFDFFTRHPHREAFEYISKKGLIQRYMHNDYLEILVETGVLGFMAFIGVILSSLLRSYRSLLKMERLREERFFQICLMSGFATMLVDAFWGFPLQLPCSGLLFWFLLSVMEKSGRVGSQKPAGNRSAL